jgi:hypothetical protein
VTFDIQDLAPRQERVAVLAFVFDDRRACDGRHARNVCEKLQLHGIGARAGAARDFLQSDGVAADLADDVGYTLGIASEIRAYAAVNVIRRYA